MRFFNKNEHADIHCNSLPHWQQGDCVTFLTWRLADSLPSEKIVEIEKLKHDFELQYPKPWNMEIKDIYHSMFDEKIEFWLQQGLGSCILANPNCRKIVEDTLLYYNYNRENETCNFPKRNEQNFSFFASFFLLVFRPLKHQLNAD